MKVLIVNGLMNLGGAEVMLMEIFRHRPKDMEMYFLINERIFDKGKRGYFDDEIEASGGKIYHIGSQGTLGPSKYIKELRQIINEINPDVVHTNLNAKNGFISLAAYKVGVRNIISHCHADIKFRGSFMHRMLNEAELFFQKILISHYCTGFWGCSKEANNRLYWPWMRSKSVIINNAIDTKKYLSVDIDAVRKLRESYNLPEECIVFGNVGRIVRHKGIAFAVEIMNELKKRGKDSAFVVAGRPDEQDYIQEMMDKAKNYGIVHRIIFLGERSDIPVVMSTFDVFVGTALREGFGMVALEAQAAGKPCVLYRGFPKQVDMSLGIVRFQEDFQPEKWADDVLELSTAKIPDKYKIAEMIKYRGFDSIKNAEVVYELYKSSL